MKIFKVALLATLISSPLAAETVKDDWEVGVFVDYIKSATGKENSSDWNELEAGRGIGVDVQKHINERWNARLELAATRYDVDDGNDKDNGLRYGVDAVYKVEDTDLYLFAGVRRFNNTQSYYAIDAGAGYNYDINERFSFYSEAAAYRDINNGETDLGLKLGIKYSFGSTKKAAPTAVAPVATAAVIAAPIASPEKEAVVEPEEKKVMPLDSDNDGVIDSEDNCANTATNLKVDSKGCALLSEETKQFNMNVGFEHNSAELKDDTLADVQRLADFMHAYKDTNVMVEGHSSAVGSASYNLTLSQKRADAVKDMLIKQYGIAASRLSAKGFGETQLISLENTKAAHKQNRRVVAAIETLVIKNVTR